MNFVHPAILGGLALAALPVIIHILNRRRFKTMEWAAMDFLLQAAVRNRRRVRLENLLLLLLRTLVVLFLVLAVARPFTRREDALAGLLGAGGVTERVLLIDDSHSMRAGRGNVSSFERAKQLAAALVERLQRERSGDRITLVLGSSPRDSVGGLTRAAVVGAGGGMVLERLRALRPSDGELRLAEAVETLLEREDDGSRVVLHVLTDFRRRDWIAPDGSMHPHVRQALERCSGRAEVRLVDVGAPPVQNMAVTALAPRDRAVVAGVPATFVATVKNYGPEPVTGASVVFRFGSHVSPSMRLEGTLRPGDEGEVLADFAFRAPGPAVVSAELPTDVLPGDDRRRVSIDVRPAMRFLLVDGEPAREAYRSEVDYAAAALSPGGPETSGIAVDVEEEHGFSGASLEAYDAVFLCNVYRIPDEALARLEAYVRAGGGLVFFLGDQVDPQVYNATFESLLPLRLRGLEGSTDDYVHLAAPDTDHPVVRFLRGVNAIVFRTAAIRYFVGCEPRDEARVILRFTDAAGSPALAERAVGEGRVLCYTTAADMEWSNLPQSPLFLALLQETARHVVRPDPSGRTRAVGEPLFVEFEPTRMRRQAVLAPPAELGGVPAELTLAEDGFRYARTLAAGVYELRLQTPEGEPYTLPFAYNLARDEGDLARADLARVEAAGVSVERAEGGLGGGDESDRTEFWRTLVLALLLAAALETLLAWRFGHHATERAEADAGGKRVVVR